MPFDHATAASRTEPLKAGKSNDTVALALIVERHDARKERKRLLGRQIALEIATGVAAGMDRPRGALHAVDQHAPEVADLHRQLALAEEISAGSGVLKPVD